MKAIKSTRRFAALTLAIALLISCLAGCQIVKDDAIDPTEAPVIESAVPGQPSETPDSPPEDTAAPVTLDALTLNFAPNFGAFGDPYVPINITPKVADYTIDKNLSNVVNLDQFPNLTADQIAKLETNGFVVAPSNQEQLFYIYEENTYKKIPNFVTTDSVLQVYHIFFDYSLRSAEAETLLPSALELNKNMLAQLLVEYAVISDADVRLEAIKAIAYFGVAQLAFGEELPTGIPNEAIKLINEEIKLVEDANGFADSPIFGIKIDYSLFTPRGHYTRSEELTKFFKGMGWYGVVPFHLFGKNLERNIPSAMQSIIITTALCHLPEAKGGALWENIYSATAFFVGAADDITPYQIAEIVKDAYGDIPDLNDIADPAKLDAFYDGVMTLPLPQIVANNGDGREALQLRFMGQRYIPDSEILQILSDYDYRPFPTGLDVFAAFGSERAADIIATVHKPAETWAAYPERAAAMKAKFTAIPDSVWQSNMYYGWLWTQKSLTGEYGEGYPMFMRNTAWQDKSLSTALGSWAEMRHDTILYAKGSAAECGGDIVPPIVRAYVEPNAELYNKLLWLTVYSRQNLSERELLPDNIKYASMRFEEMLEFLRDCSVKELNGEELTPEEYDSLLTYGGLLEYLTSSSTENGHQWHQIESETDRNMALVADVHTVDNGYLTEAVGSAAEIYVVVSIGGALYLTRGAVFDYYEFISDERLTDEQWQGMLKESPPARPEFTSSYISGEAMEVPAPIEPYSTGC